MTIRSSRWALFPPIVIITLALSLNGIVAPGQKPDHGIVFKELTGEETGLKAIMEQWKADELQRQGGQFGSHGWWPWGLAAFDYDNDGDLDLLVQQHGEPKSIIIRNELKEKGTLTFVNANPELGLPSNGLAGCFKPLIWDFDGDGFLDLAYCDAEKNTCFFNIQGKKFEPMDYAFAQLEGIKEIGDVNGDGYLDVYHEWSQFLYDPKTRKFIRHAQPLPLHGNPPEVIAEFLAKAGEKKENRYLQVRFFEGIDLNGDGIADLVCSGSAPYGGDMFGKFLLGTKDGKYTDGGEALGLPSWGTPIYVADLNGDGVADILVSGMGLYLSDSKGKFSLKPGPLTDFLKKVGPYVHKVYPVDFANHGKMDLVVSNPRGKLAAIFENRGQGDFKLLHQINAWDADPIAVCDINNDGLMDVCIGGPDDTITIFLNQTPNPGNYCNLYPRMPTPNPYAVGTKIEVYHAGDLDKPNKKPFLKEAAHPDATPIHIGLGKATTFDLRVTFPGMEPKEIKVKNVQARNRLEITPDGKLAEIK
jgi:hypothetical protein